MFYKLPERRAYVECKLLISLDLQLSIKNK